MKKILVPCDFSEPAVNAYRQAINVVAHSGGIIHLLHVVEPPILNDTMLMPTLSVEEDLMQEAKTRAQTQFKDLIKKNKIDHVKSKSEVVIGPVAECVQDYITKHDIDLVMMGSTGATGLKEFFIGSNAEKVVRQSQVPVLVIKNYYDQPIRTIVFPNTLETTHQEDLVMKVKELQEFFKAKLCIVYINILSKSEDEATIGEHLSRFAKRYMFKDYTINIHTHTSTEKGIIEFTKIAGGDMIAMGTHGRKGIVHLLKGSVAEDIVNHTERPIWTYHIKEEKFVEARD